MTPERIEEARLAALLNGAWKRDYHDAVALECTPPDTAQDDCPKCLADERTNKLIYELLNALLTEREYANARDAAYTTQEAEHAAHVEELRKQVDYIADRSEVLEAKLGEVREARDTYRDGYEARGELLGCYRIGKRPSEKLMNTLSRVGARIAELRARSEHHDNEEGKA